MTDENAEKAWEDFEETAEYRKLLADVRGITVDSEQITPDSNRNISLEDVLGEFVATDVALEGVYPGFLTGYASRDAEVESLRARLAEAEAVIESAKSELHNSWNADGTRIGRTWSRLDAYRKDGV